MSNAYCVATGNCGEPTTSSVIRELCKRPGKRDENGPIYFTEQSHKNQCDINKIIDKYDKTGIIKHVSSFEGKFGDLTGVDFKMMQDKVANARSMFQELPSNIRKEFDNDPGRLLEFMENPDNRKKAEELGIVDKAWTEESDGIGEHVKDGKHVKKADDHADATPAHEDKKVN